MVQSVSTPACHAGGRQFESVPGRQNKASPQSGWRFFVLYNRKRKGPGDYCSPGPFLQHRLDMRKPAVSGSRLPTRSVKGDIRFGRILLAKELTGFHLLREDGAAAKYSGPGFVTAIRRFGKKKGYFLLTDWGFSLWKVFVVRCVRQRTTPFCT